MLNQVGNGLPPDRSFGVGGVKQHAWPCLQVVGIAKSPVDASCSWAAKIAEGVTMVYKVTQKYSRSPAWDAKSRG